jgi:hypothetical protein
VKDLNVYKNKKPERENKDKAVAGAIDFASELKKLNEDYATPISRNKLLNQKRVKNVLKDKDDASDDDGEDVSPKAKRKITHGDHTGTKFDRRGHKESHVIKFSGEEYKNKSAKGDKIISGKYEPFAYIQLNPKATSKKNRKNAVEVFEKVMKKNKNNI